MSRYDLNTAGETWDEKDGGRSEREERLSATSILLHDINFDCSLLNTGK